MTPAEYLSPKELSKRWGGAVTTGTLANWRCRGCGPSYSKFGYKIVYPLEQLQAWEQSNLHLVGANDNERKHE